MHRSKLGNSTRYFQTFLVSFFLMFLTFGQTPSAFAQEAESERFVEEGDAQFAAEIQRLEQGSEQPDSDAGLTLYRNETAPGSSEIIADAGASTSSTYAWTAEDLAQAAYEGHLSDEGIPGYQTLANECRTGFTTARDVLRAAVKAGMMPSSVMNDAGYLNELRINLSEDLSVQVR
jgi:outer membrane usher protein FimD/PapC